MEAVKKTKLEQRMVLGLLGLFMLTSFGALKQVGLFRPRAASTAGPTASVTISPSLAETMQQSWKKMEAQLQAQPATPQAPAATAAPKTAYTAQGLRDPLQSLLPEAPTTDPMMSMSNAVSTASRPPIHAPAMTLQGLWWGGGRPMAIINGEIYSIGDRIDGATITAIDRDGVLLDIEGTTLQLTTQGRQEGSALGHGAPWR